MNPMARPSGVSMRLPPYSFELTCAIQALKFECLTSSRDMPTHLHSRSRFRPTVYCLYMNRLHLLQSLVSSMSHCLETKFSHYPTLALGSSQNAWPLVDFMAITSS